MDYEADIELRYYTDNWGPFSIDLSGGLKGDAVIAGVNIMAYAGRIGTSDDLPTLVDVAEQVIETGSIGFADTSVWWRMQYPQDQSLKGAKLTLVFDVTTSDGGRYPFYLYRVRVA